MQVTVTHADQSQNGKARVYFNGKNSWKDAYYVKQGLYLPAIGSTIEAETHSWTPPGKSHAQWFLDSYKVVTDAPAPVPAARGGNGRLPSPIEQANRVEADRLMAKESVGWDVRPEEMCKFVSNVVGQAVAAGTIKDPTDVHSWAKAAYKAATCLRSGVWNEPDRPDPNEDQGRDPDDEYMEALAATGEGRYPF